MTVELGKLISFAFLSSPDVTMRSSVGCHDKSVNTDLDFSVNFLSLTGDNAVDWHSSAS